jgi:hypothetical protein
VANQPPNFNGAMGNFREFTTRAEPTTLQDGDSLIFTVRIAGSSSRPVPRPPFQRLPEFTSRFVIEELLSPEASTGEGVWEFRYRLRPKPLTPPVKEIPSLRFDYFKPDVVPREKGYRTKYADAIPLTVHPRSEVQREDVRGGAVRAAPPEGMYEIVEGADAVLAVQAPFALPGPEWLILVFLGMPALCVGWYGWWRHAYPDAARLANRRQSRAARKALVALESATQGAVAEKADFVVDVVNGYLHIRWGLSAAEPTPEEVARHLEERGCPRACAQQAALLYQTCDVARFAPEHPAEERNLTASADYLIRSLEDQP